MREDSSPARPADSPLGEYARALRAHWVVVAVVIVCCVNAAVAWTSLQPDTYEASARVLVSPLPQDDRTFVGVHVVRDAGEPTRTIQTAATLLESEEAAGRTAERLEPPADAGEVAAAVTIEPVGESNVLAVRARADGAERAADMATGYAEQALRVRDQAVTRRVDQLLPELQSQQRVLATVSSTSAADLGARIVQLQASRRQGDPTLSLEQPAAPGVITGPSRGLVVVLSLLAGLALGTAAAVLLELTRTRVRDEEEASALFPLPVLARVPRLSRWARRAAGGGPDVDPGVQPSFQTLYLLLAERREGARAVMLASASTADGKTTAAVQLARTMALAGERVILIDCNLRSPAIARWFGIEEGAPTTDVADAEAALPRFLTPVEGLSLWVAAVPAVPGSPAAIEALVNRLPQLVQAARRRADFVVIDTPALGEVSDALPLLRAVDDVVVVTRPGHTDRRAYANMRDLMERMGAPVHGALVMGVAPDRPAPRLPTQRPERHRVPLRTWLKSAFER